MYNDLASALNNVPEEPIPPEPPLKESEETITQWDYEIEPFEADGEKRYSISNKAQLAYLAKKVNEGETYQGYTFILTANIDFQLQGGWVPIGNNSRRYFNGTFDFKGHTIDNLNIENSQYDYRGLFGNLGSNAVINEASISNAIVTGNDYIGCLAGKNAGTIRNMFISNGNVSGKESIGGVVGYNTGSISSSIYNEGTTVEGETNVGGVVGYNTSSISESINDTVVTKGKTNVGGIVGYSTGSVSNSEDKNGNIIGETNVGGIIGYNKGRIENCIAEHSAVQGNSNYGQIVGKDEGTTE